MAKEFTKKIEVEIPLGRMARKDEFNSALIWFVFNFSS